MKAELQPQTQENAYELFTKETQAIVFNYQTAAIQRMLDFDYACGRETPSVAAIVYPSRGGEHKCFWGDQEILIPIYTTIKEAAHCQPEADVLINFASCRSAHKSSMEALNTPTIRTVVIIAEGISERQTKVMNATAEKLGKWIIGPATIGGIKPGCFRIGNTGGTLENINNCRLYLQGFIGFISKSGGMANEMYNTFSRACGPKSDNPENTYPALYEGICAGGDSFPGSRIIDHLLRFEENPNIKMLVALGEAGGEDEYLIAEALRSGKITKPLVIWVMGTCSKLFPGEVQFGHAGAKAFKERDTADAKIRALREAGAQVPNSYDDFASLIHEVYNKLVESGEVETPNIEDIPEPSPVPLDYPKARKARVVRKSTSMISTISDDRGEELTYNKVAISKFFEGSNGLGRAIGHLWFKKELPEYACLFLEKVLTLTADHGPAVSGAHNAIVASRAGKDLVSSVASGMLTIGPRFGGAIDDAARYFREAYQQNLSPREFVDEMKRNGKNIPGIGHRVKSLQNPDKRVELLKDFAYQNFSKTKLLDFALEVEKITTAKKQNLILNVDGCIGVCFVDLLHTTALFSEDEIQEVVNLGALNGLFLIGRTIGMVGHVIDQKRLSEPLYRHAWDDIAYM